MLALSTLYTITPAETGQTGRSPLRKLNQPTKQTYKYEKLPREDLCYQAHINYI